MLSSKKTPNVKKNVMLKKIKNKKDTFQHHENRVVFSQDKDTSCFARESHVLTSEFQKDNLVLKWHHRADFEQ